MLENIVNATVGTDNLQSFATTNQLIAEHNEFMQLTNNRFTDDVSRGKFGKYHHQKAKVLGGVNKIYALLLRAYK